MKIFNYSKLKDKDGKLYNIAGFSIPEGINASTLIISVTSIILINLIVYPILHAFGIKYFDIKNSSYTVGIVMIVVPIIIGVSLSKIKIQSVVIYQYIVEAIKYKLKLKNTSLNGEKSNNVSEKIVFKFDDPLA